eukprot:CAMPEP_0113844756 /NCGR_PEP_ID=MMETSP0372-20130328/400_1 /TAXON_ID=340204 /ORGANISM="Lankesteria abbotti" /LENGTH=347 /DNA_ID=CAMNT_0000813767 /DNA_START=73 /DNA_END=1116 /DNA_ORIENTATION=- /assembly_acc=CAM_ASM_000359
MALPATMKAMVIEKQKEDLVAKDVDVPTLEADEVLVKVVTAGVCRTDMSVVDGHFGPSIPQLIPGHESCGTVAQVGAAVRKFKVGDRVGVPWVNQTCGSCKHCYEGWPTCCPKLAATGFQVNGGFAEYVKGQFPYVCHIPDGVTYEQASPIMCAGLTVYKGLKVSQVRAGEWVVITGAGGGLGHLACQYAKAMGMKTIAVTRKMNDEKASMFKEYNVNYVLDTSKETLDEGVKKATRGNGAQGMLCLSPGSDMSEAPGVLAPRGTVVLIGAGESFSINPVVILLKSLRVVGSAVGNTADLEEALQFAADGLVKVKVQTKKLTEVNDALKSLRECGYQGRVVLQVSSA